VITWENSSLIRDAVRRGTVQRFAIRILVPVLNFRFTEPKIPRMQKVPLQIRCALDVVPFFLHIFPSRDFTHCSRGEWCVQPEFRKSGFGRTLVRTEGGGGGGGGGGGEGEGGPLPQCRTRLFIHLRYLKYTLKLKH